MGKATINFNVLAQTVTDRAKVINDARVISGSGIVVMDDPVMTQELRGTFSHIVHRRYMVEDAELYKRMSPSGWLDRVVGDSRDGVIVQCHNEPRIHDSNVEAFASWNVDVLRQAHSRGIRLAVGTFGVGNPHESLIERGAFDPMLVEMNANDVLMVHEYFIDNPIGVKENPWLVGRLEWWIERLISKSRCRTILVGEMGRDLGGGQNDGWRGTGWSAEQYAQRLIAQMQVYAALAKRYDVNIYGAVFGVGRGFGDRWQSFNIESEPVIYGAMRNWNGQQVVTPPAPPPAVPTVPKPTAPGEAVEVLLRDPDGQGINVRGAPTTQGARLATLRGNTALLWYPDTERRAGGFRWFWIEAPATAAASGGWMALIADTPEEQFVPMQSPPVPDETVVQVPYYSQLTSPGAQFDRNDCGETSARMLIGYLLRSANLPDFPGITIDDLTRDAGKTAHAFLSLGQLERLLQLYGLPKAKYSYGGVTLARIEQEINAGRPLIALVRYKQIKPDDSFTGSHFVVVVGYSSSDIIVHDPLRGGASLRVPRARFELALTDFGGTNPHHSGVLIDAA